MVGQDYIATFSGVAVSAIQDLFEIVAAAAVPVIVRRIRIAQSSDAGDAQAEMLHVQLSRTDGTSSGTGGSTLTPQKYNSPAAPAASSTVEANNATTQATVATPFLDDAFNVQAGWDWAPMSDDELVLIPGGGTLVVELPTAPADALTMSGSVVFTELK